MGWSREYLVKGGGDFVDVREGALLTWNTLVVHLEVVALLLTRGDFPAEASTGEVDAAPLLPHTGVVLMLPVDTVPGGVGTPPLGVVPKEHPVDSQHGPRSTLDVDFVGIGEAGTG